MARPDGLLDAHRLLRDAAVLVCGLALLIVFVLPMRLGGSLLPVVVTGGSMVPTYEPGDLIITRATERFDPGDVAVVEVPGGGIVIHRVVRTTPAGPVTRGDALDWDDPWPVDAVRPLATATGLRVPGFGQVLLSLATSPLWLAGLCAVVGGVVAGLAPAARRPRPDLRAATAAVRASITTDAAAAGAAALVLVLAVAALV